MHQCVRLQSRPRRLLRLLPWMRRCLAAAPGLPALGESRRSVQKPAPSRGFCGAWLSCKSTEAASLLGSALLSLWRCAQPQREAACASTRRLRPTPRRLRLRPGHRRQKLRTALRPLHGQDPRDLGGDFPGQRAGQRNCCCQRHPGECTLRWSLRRLQGIRRPLRELRCSSPGCSTPRSSSRPPLLQRRPQQRDLRLLRRCSRSPGSCSSRPSQARLRLSQLA